MLLTGINTDAPGQVAAQVLSDVYDYTGTNLLVPSGSQVLGTVSGTDGSSGRVSVTFNTLVTPNGDSWNVGSSFQPSTAKATPASSATSITTRQGTSVQAS